MDIMTIIGNWVYNNVGLTLGIIAAFFEITPIKINPIRWVLKKCADIMAGSIDKSLNLTERIEQNNKNIEELQNTVIKMEADRQELKAKNSRTRILQFADEISRGNNHSKDYFNDIMDDIDRYERYCSGHPEFSNGRTVAAKALIKETYSKNLKEHTFL